MTWDQGLIPTHAGKTCLAGLVGAHSEAHPRSRGENVGALSGGGCVQGSSPLTRGKRGHGSDRVGTGGLIPTHAGKTRPRSSGARTRWAHPHSRGENPTLSWASGEVTGSSPLTRGKRFDPVGAHDLRGLIPTHAGKTRRALAVQRGSRGSSPLTRGKRGRRRGEPVTARLIPTHAGKTPTPGTREEPEAAHPHSCGENPVFLEIPGKGTGSSPLTRGKRVAPPGPLRGPGLIPTHAGKTTCRRASRGATWAHPHSRGENVFRLVIVDRSVGSSPLTRGKRRVHRQAAPLRGLIPTHAGKTAAEGGTP